MLAGWASTCNGRPPPFAADHPVRGDRPWAHTDSARGGGDVVGCCARPRRVCGRGGPSSLRRAPRLYQVSQRKGLERVLQVGVRQAHDLPPRTGLHARLRQGGDARRHAATSARLSLPDPVLAKRGRRHLREPAHVRPPPRRDPLLRHGVDAQPRNAALALEGLRISLEPLRLHPGARKGPSVAGGSPTVELASRRGDGRRPL
jgi:hypothetical protein